MMLFRKLNHLGWKCLSRGSFGGQISKYQCDAGRYHEPLTSLRRLQCPPPCHYSTMVGRVLVQAPDIGKVHEELEAAINEHRLSDAWDLHSQHMKVEGFARKSVFIKLIARLTQSLDPDWIDKAYVLVEEAFEENNHSLFDRTILIYLALGLAKCGRSVPASTLLRKLVEMKDFPPVSAWSAILAYMSENSSGAYLAAELILEIGYLFQDGWVDPRKECNQPLLSMKPNTISFNLALAGCLLFGTTKKAEQLLDMIPRLCIKIDATLLIIMTHIYESNGRRDELKKLRRHIEEIQNASDQQMWQFYNCLLSCHLKFGDLDSASHMVLEILRKAKKAQNSLGIVNLLFGTDKRTYKTPDHDVSVNSLCHMRSTKPGKVVAPQSHILSYEDFCRDTKFLRLEAEAKEVLDGLILQLQRQVKFITTGRGMLKATASTCVKLVKAFLEAGKTKELAEFLIKAEKEDSPASVDDSALVHVINSCISLGMLDQAHDLLDEMRLAGIRTCSAVYGGLLKAYSKENRMGEVTSLIRDARKAGIQLDGGSYGVLIHCRVIENDTHGGLNLIKEMKEAKISKDGHQEFDDIVKHCAEDKEGGLMSKLLHEIKEEQKVDSRVHDWNNVIHFFSRKRLMQDAEKALKKMLSLGLVPNAQTFHSMATGYAAVGEKYTEVAQLWGQMKPLASSSGMTFDQELLDSVLHTFVRGGFFKRAIEIVEMMEKENMFIDKYKYRSLFLKYHRTLYKGNAPEFQTESQLKRREATLNFKKWVGLF